MSQISRLVSIAAVSLFVLTAQAMAETYPDRVVRIPQAAGERCLNLSTAVGIALYEAIGKTTKPQRREDGHEGR